MLLVFLLVTKPVRLLRHAQKKDRLASRSDNLQVYTTLPAMPYGLQVIDKQSSVSTKQELSYLGISTMYAMVIITLNTSVITKA